MIKTRKLNYDRALPLFMIVFVDVLGLTIILPLLHLYALAYGAAPLQIGLVVAAFPIAQLVGVPILGILSDQFGRKPILLISQMSTCIGFILLALGHSLTLIILSRVIDGLFGANIATAQAALADLTTEKNRTQGLGLTGAAFGLGFIVGPVISIGLLEFSDNLALPALVAATYSFLSILLTWFMFQETLPASRNTVSRRISLSGFIRVLRVPQVNWLLLLMFAQQTVFFGFESLLGLFTLSRLGLLGQGNALLFIVVGLLLIVVQVRYIGRLSQKYGEGKLVYGALALLAIGLLLVAFTPDQPEPFYVRSIAERTLQAQTSTGTEAIIGVIAAPLPDDGHNGIIGVLWLFTAIVPLSMGAGLIRPGLNSLMTGQVLPGEYGSTLGFSTAFVSLANAIAPLLSGWLFQKYGSTVPFLAGGLLMSVLAVVSWRVIATMTHHERALSPKS
jgi:DHA1 family tetracycline resistance protein-like MFS transporter